MGKRKHVTEDQCDVNKLIVELFFNVGYMLTVVVL